jgi:hypothetical protein
MNYSQLTLFFTTLCMAVVLGAYAWFPLSPVSSGPADMVVVQKSWFLGTPIEIRP